MERGLTALQEAALRQKPVESSGALSGTLTPAKPETKVRGSRAAYMKAFRKRPVVCPACGHTFKELKRVKE